MPFMVVVGEGETHSVKGPRALEGRGSGVAGSLGLIVSGGRCRRALKPVVGGEARESVWVVVVVVGGGLRRFVGEAQR
jgi:hypothetical protein